MLRGFLICGALLVGCSKSGGDAASAGGPAVVVGAKVGVVVELAGKVTATRAGATRDLAAGGEVSGDDKIATGDDARVVIELAHNGAKWSLGANKAGVVSESVAWALPKVTGPAGTNESDMTAGGRHSEKSAADTGVTGGKAAAAVPTNMPMTPTAHTESAPVMTTPPAKDVKQQKTAPPGGPPPPTVQPDPAAATDRAQQLILHDKPLRACVAAGKPGNTLKLVVRCERGACKAVDATKSTPCLDTALAAIVLDDKTITFDLTLVLSP